MIKNQALIEIDALDKIENYQELKVKYLGKKGLITLKQKQIVNVPIEQERQFGYVINKN